MTTSVSSSAPYATTKLHELYQTKQYTDCAFLVRNERFPCHRFHLALCSPVFESMLYGPLSKPTTKTLTNDIRVDDVDPKCFQLMLDYLYTGDITFTSTEEACQVLYLAQKYILEELTRVTINYLQKHFSLNSLPLCFEYGQLYGDKELLQSCEKDLITYAVGVLFFIDYHLKRENFKYILDTADGRLSNCQKTLAAIRWGIDECCLRREGQVGLEDLREELTKAGLLTKIDLCGYKTEDYYTKLLPNFEQLDSYAKQLSNSPPTETRDKVTDSTTSNSKVAVAKLRYNFRRVLKSGSSLEIHRDVRQFFKTVLIADKTILVFGLAISTKNLPYYHTTTPSIIQRATFNNVLVLLQDFTNGGRLCYQMRSSVADTDNCYHDNVQLVRFHVPVVLTAGNKYVVSVSYESDEEGVCVRTAPSVGGGGVRRESVLLKYMTEGVQCSQQGDCNVMFYDFEGSVLHGLSFYEL